MHAHVYVGLVWHVGRVMGLGCMHVGVGTWAVKRTSGRLAVGCDTYVVGE